MKPVPPQACAGAIFMTVGIAGALLSRSYAMGTAIHMGPGFFPSVLSVLVFLLGAGGLVRAMARRDGGGLPSWEFLDLGFLLAGVVLFAILIDRTGLVEAVAALIVLACYRRLRQRPVEVVALCAGLTAFSGAVFVEAFGLPFAWF
jgi:hypothetical protein